DPGITVKEAFELRYHQTEEIANRRARAHPHFTKRYPELAELWETTLRASRVRERPGPDAWRPTLKAIAKEQWARKRVTGVTIDPYPATPTIPQLRLGDNQKKLDLYQTPFSIRVTLERNDNGSIDAVVHSGATIQAQIPNKAWEGRVEGNRIEVLP